MWQHVLDLDDGLGVIELKVPMGHNPFACIPCDEECAYVEYRIRFMDGKVAPISTERYARICAAPRWRRRELVMFESVGRVAVWTTETYTAL
jgi:hypothetical protein